MYTHLLEAGIGAPIDFVYFLATEFKRAGKRVAILDFSRAFLVSMVATGKAYFVNEKAYFAMFEKRYTREEITQQFITEFTAKTNTIEIPVIKAVHNQINVYDEGRDSPGLFLETFKTNLKVLEGFFDIIIGMSEFVFSDLTGFFFANSDVFVIKGDSALELNYAINEFGKYEKQNVIIVKGISVPSGFRTKKAFVKRVLPYEIKKIAKYILKNFATTEK